MRAKNHSEGREEGERIITSFVQPPGEEKVARLRAMVINLPPGKILLEEATQV